MLKNYLKIAIRNLIRHKVFSLINILGLSIGMVCTVLIVMWIFDELSYDTFLDNADNIYRINTELRFGGKDLDMPLSSDMMGAALKKDFPQIKEFIRLYAFGGTKLVKLGNDFFNEYKTVYADSTFFKVFNFPVIAGNTKSALDQPNTVVINESTAKKYFGKTDVVGNTLETNDNNGTAFIITAVIKDMPRNTHFNFDFIFPMQNLKYPFGNYMSTNFYTYLLLQDGTDYKEFEKNLEQYIIKYSFPYAKQLIKINSIEDFEKAGNKIRHTLTPVTKIHLHSNREYELGVNGNIQYVYIFSTIALFILLIASVNFMNLTTSRSANRAREVGIRKVLGTERKNLIVQFLTESIIIAYFSIVVTAGLVYLLLPLFNSISGKQLLFATLFDSGFFWLLILLPLVVGLLTGYYPALLLSGLKPAVILKGKMFSRTKGGNLRGALIIFQFTTSIVLIIATLVIYMQLNYIQNKNLGYNKEQVLVIDNAFALKGNVDVFKNEMLNIPGVKEATVSGYLPIPSIRANYTFFKDASMDLNSGFNMQRWQIDYNYFDFMRMKIISGRNFSREFGTDTTAIIINEEAVKQLGYSDPIGKELYTIVETDLKKRISYRIIGVVKNFHFESLRQPIGPLSFLLRKNNGSCSFRVNAPNIAGVLDRSKILWKSLASDIPFNFRFMDESFNAMYFSERNVSLTALASSLLAVFVASLGLFGLSIFMAQQKTKEIGIRKTFGASETSILLLLLKEFLKWIAIANIIAWPIAYYFMNKWLQDFAYRVEFSWWIFVLSGGIAIAIALATVSFQAIKAAIANPVESLRYE